MRWTIRAPSGIARRVPTDTRETAGTILASPRGVTFAPGDVDDLVETAQVSRVRQKITAALFDAATPILITGPSGHGKTLLLRSLWRRPPRGFAPILAPCAGVAPEPDAIAARILAGTRKVPSSDPAADFVRMLRTQSLRGALPVLLLDDAHDVSPEAIAALVALAGTSRVAVRWIAAGIPGPALDTACSALPEPPRAFALDDRFTDTDVKRLIARIADASPDVASSIDVDEVMRGCDGNPRLVLASLASQLRSFEPQPVEIESAMAPPEPARPPIDRTASSKPAPAEIPAAALRPVRAAPLRAAPPRVAPLRTAPPRAPRRGVGRPSGRRLLRGFGVLAACGAIVWLVDRAPSIGAGSFAVVGQLTARSASSMRDAWGWIETTAFGASQQLGELESEASRQLRGSAALAAQWTTDSIARVREWRSADSGGRTVLADADVATATPAIPVGVNSNPWANVEIDGSPVGSTPLTIELAPGPHRFRAAMANGRVLEKSFVVSEQRNQVVFD
jgi:hypothetical protein